MTDIPPSGSKGQLAFDLEHTPSHAEADFLIGDGNRLAYAHLAAFPAWSAPLTLIIGPAKSGKSHLARVFAERSGAAMAGIADMESLAAHQDRAPLIIEDIDRGGYDEAAVFHLLNQSMRDRRPLLMTAREPVANWPYKTDDVLSRARLAASFSLSITDDIQLSQMFAKLFSDRQIAVDPKVIAYIVARMERSPEEANALVDLMDRLALANKSAVTRTIAAEALDRRKVALAQTPHPDDAESDNYE